MHPAHGSDRPHGVWPPDPVKQVTGLYLDLVDECAPGLIEGLYLRGSLGLRRVVPRTERRRLHGRDGTPHHAGTAADAA